MSVHNNYSCFLLLHFILICCFYHVHSSSGFVKMELNASFTDLFSHFDQKLQGLTICLAIKQNSGQEWQEALLHNVVSQLSSLRISLSLIKSRLREQKEILDKANVS